jgi:threonine/homoserine/homoserine lactone efflux protein
LSAFLAAVPAAYTAVRVVGGCYLIYLGVKAFRTASEQRNEVAIKAASKRRIFIQGAITNVLNPKVALFFLAFLPQFTDTAKGSLGRQVLVLGLLFNLSGTIVNVAVGWFASALTSRARESSGTALWLQRFTGALFVGLGLRLITSAKR